jgi:DnaK suppressor protein
MTSERKTELELIIKSEIEKITLKLEDLKSFTEPVAPDNAIGRISRMDAINNKTIFDASQRNLKNRMIQLEQSLKRIHDDDFGICIECRQSIPLERLKIRPEIRFCATCFKRDQ